jgi:hypothetical protein
MVSLWSMFEEYRGVYLPIPLIEPAMTVLPGCFSTGLDSPVNIDSSTSDTPEMTVPSVGTRESGMTLKTSPNCNNLASIGLD